MNALACRRLVACLIGVIALLFLSALSARTQENGGKPDPTLKPAYGDLKLEAGFTEDPRVVKLTAGGPIRTNLGGVNAWVAKAPDFKLYYTAGNLPLTIHVESEADT